VDLDAEVDPARERSTLVAEAGDLEVARSPGEQVVDPIGDDDPRRRSRLTTGSA